ncbi:putative sulfate transporter [Paramyrothecium foliicola]|nr:putative sulfate transporter [Paramyrothecium foliicola]
MAAERIGSLFRHLAPGSSLNSIQSKNADDIVITLAIRTPLTKAKKGGFKDTSLEYLVYATLKEVRERSKIDPALVEDICLGNVSDGKAAYKARAASLAAGFPNTAGASSVNRFCSSGLKATADIAHAIATGSIAVGIAIGAETMSIGGDRLEEPFDEGVVSQSQEAADCMQPMGWTSENVSRDFGITREAMDAFAAESFQRAERAQKDGWFDDEIVPITTKVKGPDGELKEVTLTKDEGIRPGTTAESLGKIRAAFPQWGPTTTGGNASQVTDGAAAVLLMKRSTAIKLGQPILAKYVGSTVAGLAPRIMGIGPSVAIPKLLAQHNVTLADMDVVEVNEAFASMAVYCRDKLGLDWSKMNPRGGAIALGHPLGATGARQIVTGLSELRRTKKKMLLISMCIGTGQGMAGLFVNEQAVPYHALSLTDWTSSTTTSTLFHVLSRASIPDPTLGRPFPRLHASLTRSLLSSVGLYTILTMTGKPTHSRTSSYHRPNQPSALRQSYTADSPKDAANPEGPTNSQPSPPVSPGPGRAPPREGIFASESTPLIRTDLCNAAHAGGVCTHGTFSPRPTSPAGFGDQSIYSEASSDTAGPSGSGAGDRNDDDWKEWLKRRMRTKKMGRSRHLAAQAGFEDTPLMYLAYYIPCLTWMHDYQLSYLQGDLVSAITMASFYLPMALSLAANLAHVPPIHGLYSFVFNPLIYALLGSCPQMVVGPEAAGSLLVGSIIKSSVDEGHGGEDNDLMHAQICGVAAGIAGATVLIAGLARLGFLDSVLSRPFLRGFISAIGFVIAIDQLIPELGLAELASETGVSHGSSAEKFLFTLRNLKHTHMLTFGIAAVSFTVIMIFRELKKRLQPRYPGLVFIPDRFLVVVAAALLCWKFEWQNEGVEILGTVKSATGGLFAFRWPFQLSHMHHIRDAMSTSFLIALLGFFESSVAAKSLGGSENVHDIQLSANREMIALGTANFVGACFMSLPAFGGYGRSKVNKSAGGKTPMSSVFLSMIALLSILFLLPYFYFLPKPVLSAMISVVAWSLIEEAPHDIFFFARIRGWTELCLMAIIFVATIFYSLTLGMALGVGISLLQVIKHSTRPRIQIMGRIPGTNRFENAESANSHLEHIEGCLIVKIPEPLTFANTGELKARLRRLELYGTSEAHPALPRLRSHESNRNVIFDIHGVTSLDGSGTQVLEEIVSNYQRRGVRVFFSRGPSHKGHDVWQKLERSGIVALCGGERYFVNDVEEALRLSEYEESVNEEEQRRLLQSENQ